MFLSIFRNNIFLLASASQAKSWIFFKICFSLKGFFVLFFSWVNVTTYLKWGWSYALKTSLDMLQTALMGFLGGTAPLYNEGIKIKIPQWHIVIRRKIKTKNEIQYVTQDREKSINIYLYIFKFFILRFHGSGAKTLPEVTVEEHWHLADNIGTCSTFLTGKSKTIQI